MRLGKRDIYFTPKAGSLEGLPFDIDLMSEPLFFFRTDLSGSLISIIQYTFALISTYL